MGGNTMIKYETDLVEAKKIKELGYDFSFVDKDFFVDCDWDIDEGYIFSDSLVRITNTGKSGPYSRYQVIEFIKAITYDSGDKSEIDDDNFFVNLKQMTTISEYSREGTVFNVYPIIPYPILEACLPAVRTKAPFNGFVDSSIRALFFGTYQMIDEQIDDYSCLDDYILNDFENAYEAFIWCAENYPEETKAKFEEIKKEYE